MTLVEFRFRTLARARQIAGRPFSDGVGRLPAEHAWLKAP